MIVDGKALAFKKEQVLKIKVEELKKKGVKLKLVLLVLADDSAGLLYSELKKQGAERIGIDVKRVVVVSSEKLFELVKKYNRDKSVNGIVIQYPGGHLVYKLKMDWEEVVSLIDKKKDVDGLRGDSEFELAVVRAVMDLIKSNIPLRSGMLVVVVGAKGFVGKRLVRQLTKMGRKVVGVDVGDDLVKECLKADVLISVTGQTDLIGSKMVKDGAAVIDVGWPKGDVQFGAVKKKASLITPVPGGVGPLTVISLLENLVKASYTST